MILKVEKREIKKENFYPTVKKIIFLVRNHNNKIIIMIH
jgi:hypothetical protein